MAEDQSPPGAAPLTTLPQKRPLEDVHSPAVSSPLNPNAPSHPADVSMPRGRPPGRPAGREPREKKDSLKKREASGATTGGRGGTPDSQNRGASSKRDAPSNRRGSVNDSMPLRYQINPPRSGDYEPVRDPLFSPREPEPLYTPDGKTELKRPLDHAENRKNYRYTYAVADPQFRHKQYYRASEGRPFGPRMSFEDADKSFWFDEEGKVLCNEKGWRLARANVVAREGSMYYEVKILRGVPPEGPPVPPTTDGPLPHVRMGWARREAPLDAPVGFDGYGYGITDIRFETMHRSRAGKFFHPAPKDEATGKPKPKAKPTIVEMDEATAHVREGDVIGLEISLPSLHVQQAIISGAKNSTDTPDDQNTSPEDGPLELASDIVRDRIPVHYKGNVYFEQAEYVSTKPLETYNDRSLPLTSLTAPSMSSKSASSAAATQDPQVPHPQHKQIPMRSLPDSSIRIFRNGELVGTAFENLLAFLPPASKSYTISNQEERTLFDDGMLGYYPAVSSFAGGVAEINLGPDFWFPPKGSGLAQKPKEDSAPNGDGDGATQDEDVEMGGTEAMDGGAKPLRAMSERFAEQIAEDIVWDVVDEACFFIEDGGFGNVPEAVDGVAASTPGLNGDTE